MSQYFNQNVSIFELVVSMVPHFFEGKNNDQAGKKGNKKSTWPFNNNTIVSAYRINAKKTEYTNFITEILKLEGKNYPISQSKRLILREWVHSLYGMDHVLYEKVASIIDDLDMARNENKNASVNLIITNIEENVNHVSLMDAQEYIVGIQYSSSNYIKLTSNANSIIDICHLATQTSAFKFLPYGLNQYIGFSKEMQYGVLYCENGDVFLINHKILMASRRNQKWYCHDLETMKNLFFSRFESRTIGKLLLAVAFHISYKQKGGLILYRPFKQTVDCLTNDILNYKKSYFHESILSRFKTIKQNLIVTGKDSINIKEENIELLADLATLDGCIVIGKTGLEHVGGLIAFNNQEAKKILDDVIGARNATYTYTRNIDVIGLKISQTGLISLFTKYVDEYIEINFM